MVDFLAGGILSQRDFVAGRFCRGNFVEGVAGGFSSAPKKSLVKMNYSLWHMSRRNIFKLRLYQDI